MSRVKTDETLDKRILAHLSEHPGKTDREIKEALGVKGGSQTNTTTRKLAEQGLVRRTKGANGQIRNEVAQAESGRSAGTTSTLQKAIDVLEILPDAIALGQGLVDSTKGAVVAIKGAIQRHGQDSVRTPDETALEDAVDESAADAAEGSRPWFWEGNVQAAVVRQLGRTGYAILRAADTASHAHGRDIEAQGSGRLWVTVKGYPNGTERTRADTQARHWFKHALYDIVDWRGQDSAVLLAIALPDFPVYRRMAERVHWLEPVARFGFVWVNRRGKVDLPREITGDRR